MAMNTRNEVLRLKQEALEIKQDIDHLVTFYRRFQAYVERLAAVLAGQAEVDEALTRERTALELAFEREHEYRFRGWENGERTYRESVYDLIHRPDGYKGWPDVFAQHVQDAAVTFEHLFENRERELRNLHEQIALVEGENEARRITTLRPAPATAAVPVAPPPPATNAAPPAATGGNVLERVRQAEEIVDKAYTWGERALTFLPWAYQIARIFGAP